MISRQELAKKIFEISHLKGEFRLRSGAVSNEYFDKYLFEAKPVLLQQIAQAMSAHVPSKVDALAGLDLGGYPLPLCYPKSLAFLRFSCAKLQRSMGRAKLAEGGEVAGRTLVVVEDVVTSGGQILLSTRELRKLGAHVTHVMCVIDREAGGTENLAQENLQLHSLFTMSELKAAVSD